MHRTAKLGITIAAGSVFIVDSEDAGFIALQRQGFTDLVPLCPNCHAMVHRSNESRPLSVEALRSIIDEAKNGPMLPARYRLTFVRDA